MRLFLCVILSLLLTNCGEVSLSRQYHPSQKSMLVDEISNKVFKQLKTEKNLYPIECGGRMMNQIILLHWGFFYYNEIGIDEARKLLFEVGNLFLSAFNADERIRPYLATYPLTPKNIQLEIFLKRSDGTELGTEKLHVISIEEGMLDYMIQSSETKRLKMIHKETYEEAVAKLGNVQL